MTSSNYGTVESQGDASLSPPKSYRLSKVAKIALAMIACSAAAVIAHPGTRQTTTSFQLKQWHSGNFGAGTFMNRAAGGAARPVPVESRRRRVFSPPPARNQGICRGESRALADSSAARVFHAARRPRALPTEVDRRRRKLPYVPFSRAARGLPAYSVRE